MPLLLRMLSLLLLRMLLGLLLRMLSLLLLLLVLLLRLRRLSTLPCLHPRRRETCDSS